MKKQIFVKIVSLVTISVIIFLTLTQQAKSKNKEVFSMKCEYIIIYYIHPAIMTYTPVAKDDIEERCLSKIIVGDGPKIEEISGILTKIKENQEGSKGITDSVTFKIKLKFPNEEKIWFVDKSHNFEFNTIDKGKIPTKYFESLISIFDNYTKVVDLKYWEEFKKDK